MAILSCALIATTSRSRRRFLARRCLGLQRRFGQLNDFVRGFNAVIHGYADCRVTLLIAIPAVSAASAVIIRAFPAHVDT
jgi:hypothetical protein